MTDPKHNVNTDASDDENPTSVPVPIILAPPSSFRMPASVQRSLRTADSPISPAEVAAPDVDQSFMRWSTASEVFSEADMSTWSFNPHPSSSSLIAPRNSRITDISELTTATTSDSDFGSVPNGRSSFDTFGARTQSGLRPPAASMKDTSSGKSRPMTMSSASMSLYRNALAELDKFVAANKVEGEVPPSVSLSPRMGIIKVHSGSNTSRRPVHSALTNEDCSSITSHSISLCSRRHRSNASVPLAELPFIPETSPVSNRASIQSPRARTRSKSIDSVSINHSVSDSVTGLLLPPDHMPKRLPLVHSHSLLPTDLATKNELNPEQRAVLLRRAKKLEQLLGQSLDERSIERLLIDPIHATRTVTTHAVEEAWPSSPSDGGKQGEWQRDDCVPRKGRQVDMPALVRSGSVLAKRARAALGLESKIRSGAKGDLAVFVSREMRVSETSVRGVRPHVRDSLSSLPATVVRHDTPLSPRSILEDMNEDDVDEDEALRRTRRMQLAKLHRLLGVHIPLDLMLRQGQELPEPAGANDSSFMTLEEKGGGIGSPGWAARLKSTLNAVRPNRETGTSASSSPETPQDESFVDMNEVMTDKEKAVARKRAQKLEYMFGDVPPQKLFLPLRPTTPPDSEISNRSTSFDRDQQSAHGSFEAYERSLKGLLYLVEYDPPSLDNLMDQLDDTTRPIPLTRSKSISPKSPSASFFAGSTPDPDSHGARRKRTGKLTHFFGETGIDFDDPPTVEDTMDKVRAQKRSSVRRETMDSMMREMWKGVQGEVKRGTIAVTDGEMLAEMIERLRRRRGSVGQWEVL